MRRREFITLLGGAATAWPLAARAQQSAMPVIGLLDGTSPDGFAFARPAFQQGLSDAGYAEGRNVTVLYRSAEDQNERLPALAAELVGRRVAVIVATGGTISALAAKAATATTPIVFINGADPVKLGLVASLNRPGGNVTGINFLVNLLVAKRLELLHELLPQAAAIGMLVDPSNPNAATDISSALAAAAAVGRQIHVLEASSERDVEQAFTALIARKTDALFVAPHAVFNSRRDQLIALTARNRIPTIYPSRAFVSAGGLMSYGTSILDAYRHGGAYAGRILKGEHPADLPVMQSIKFELLINLKTAKTLDLEVPAKLLALADEVIE
jgi:putative tryptophan/tyrosine transport system substrate-binding protein